MVQIYRQKYDILKLIEAVAYKISQVECWGSLFIAIVIASYILGFFDSTETTLLGQLFRWLA